MELDGGEITKEALEELETLKCGESFHDITIPDYRDAIPFDVYVWSDYPEINIAVDTILPNVLFGSTKDRKSLRNHLKVILINLYVAYLSGNKWISYSRDRNKYKTSSRYTKIFIKYNQMISITNTLIALEYIDHKPGYKPVGGKSNGVLSKMRAKRKLKDIFYTLNDTMVTVNQERETIVLKDKDKNKIEYSDTIHTERMRKRLVKINNLLCSTDITLNITTEELAMLNKKVIEEHKIPVLINQKRLHRVFNMSSFTLGSRFYGGWWENVPEAQRRNILINGGSTVEKDYKCLHPSLLYLMETGKLPEGDCYILEGHEGDKAMRTIVKDMFLMLLNSENETQAKRAFNKRLRHNFDTEVHALIKNIGLDEVIRKIKAGHPKIGKHFCSNIGRKLQYQDSQLAEWIMIKFQRDNIPCLPIHDSFIVPLEYGTRLEETMKSVFEHKYGAVPLVE